jgi:transposase InsO family protein
MSQAHSPSAKRPYGLARVCRVWRVPRSSVYDARSKREAAARGEVHAPRKRGPVGACSDEDLLRHIQAALDGSPWVGEGHRKVWARLRVEGVCTSRRRVLRIMRENGLLAPQRAGHAHGPKAHDGTIVPEKPDEMWGTDMTGTLTREEGQASIFFVLDHCTAECLGIHAAHHGTRFDALEALRQGVRERHGVFAEGIAEGVTLRHDNGSQFTSHAYQQEVHFLGIESSPSYVREPQGNGCAERFVRTLKEQLLWLERFDTVDALNEALQELKDRYNNEWLIERHGWISPAQQYRKLTAREAAA